MWRVRTFDRYRARRNVEDPSRRRTARGGGMLGKPLAKAPLAGIAAMAAKKMMR